LKEVFAITIGDWIVKKKGSHMFPSNVATWTYVQNWNIVKTIKAQSQNGLKIGCKHTDFEKV